MNPTTQEYEMLDERGAADLLGLKPATLRQWRMQERGPAFVRMQRTIRYRREDLLAYLNAAIVTPSTR